jgi:hypothetical protein
LISIHFLFKSADYHCDSSVIARVVELSQKSPNLIVEDLDLFLNVNEYWFFPLETVSSG